MNVLSPTRATQKFDTGKMMRLDDMENGVVAENGKRRLGAQYKTPNRQQSNQRAKVDEMKLIQEAAKRANT